MPLLARIVDRRFCHQPMLYWEFSHSDEHGKAVYNDPIPLKCRWEDREEEVLTPDRRKVLAKAYILLTTEMKPLGVVFRGTELQWQALPSYPGVPTVQEGGLELLTVRRTPDHRNASVIYEAYA